MTCLLPDSQTLCHIFFYLKTKLMPEISSAILETQEITFHSFRFQLLHPRPRATFVRIEVNLILCP